MSVKVREYKKRGKSGWEVDIMFKWPDGELYRERVKAPVGSKSGAKSWGEQRQAELLSRGRKAVEKQTVPTLKEFAPRYLDEGARANRQKPSTIIQKKRILDFYLLPRFGEMRLDAISNAEVAKLKAELVDRSPKTVNNVLVVLNTAFKTALKWGVIEQMPATIELLRVAPSTVDFYEPHEYERLVEAAAKVDHQHLVFIPLGGEAGATLRGDHRLGADGRGFHPWRHPCPPLGVGRARHPAQGRTGPAGEYDRSAGGCPPQAAAPPRRARPLAGRWLREGNPGAAGQMDEPHPAAGRTESDGGVSTSSATPSARGWRWREPRPRRSRSWPGTSTSPPPSGTYT
jgi:hypothetical protein